MKPGILLAGRYRLDARVGGGGMGHVWRAYDTVLKRTVAIKVLHTALSTDDRFREQFRQEALTVAALRHPSVVDLHDYNEERLADDTLTAYLVMQFVDGRPLSDLLAEQGGLGVADSMRIVARTAEALECAHAAGVVHRDVKPENILVREDGSVVLVDFGLAGARLAASDSETPVQGTASYMSPEQASNKALTGASDIYSLGVVAYQCLSGKKPFRASDPADVLLAHLIEQPASLPEDVPPVAARLVEQAMAKDPQERFASAAELAAACRQIEHSTDTLAPLLEQAESGEKSDRLRPAVAPRPAPEDQPDSEPPIPVPSRGRRRTPLVVLAFSLLLISLLFAHWRLPGGLTPVTAVPPPASSTAGPGSSDGATATGSPSTTSSADSSAGSGADATSADESTSPATGQPDRPEPTTASSSAPETVIVPDVNELNQNAATQKLESHGFQVEVDRSGDGSVACPVHAQEPSGGESAETGSTVTIHIRLGENGREC